MSQAATNPAPTPQLNDKSTSNNIISWQTKTTDWIKNNLTIILVSVLSIILLIGVFIFRQTLFPQNQSISLEETGSRNNFQQNTAALINTPTTKQDSNAPPLPSPSPTPTTLVPDDGVKGTYKISQSKHDGPTISKVVFDPLDAKRGQPLTINLYVLKSTPANQITATLQTDASTEKLTFTKSSTKDKYDVWTANLTLPQSVLYKYILTVSAQSKAGNSQIIVAPRS